MFAMTSGTTNRPKTIPVTARVAPATIAKAGRSGASWRSTPTPTMLRKGLKPILQIASDWRESFTPVGHPLRGDHRA